ncbi:MAG: phage regulatory CII family protein [Opitutales bacterium]
MSAKSRPERRRHVKPAHAVVRDALLRGGEGAGGRQLEAHAAIAKAVGVSTSMLYKWREPSTHGSGQPNPLERAALLLEATGDQRIADWFAQRAGGHFMPEKAEADTPELSRAANALVREFGLVIAEVVGAVEDHRITGAEARELRGRWDALRKRAESFIRACERGDYTPEE